MRPAPASLLALAMLLAAAPARPEPLPVPFHAFGGVAATDDASAFFVNPAAGGLRYPGELALSWTEPESGRGFARGALALRGLGLTGEYQESGRSAFGLATRGGEDAFRLGFALDWVGGPNGAGRAADLRVGALSRPAPWASFGATASHLAQPRVLGVRARRSYALGLALRPLALARGRAHDLGTRLALAADVVMDEGAAAGAAKARVGGELELLPGLILRGSGDSGGGWRAGFSLLGPRGGYHASAAFDRDGGSTSQTHALTLHRAEDRTALASARDRRIGVISLGGALADEALADFSVFGAGSSVSAAPYHRQLERALEDPLTRGVLLELRGVSGLAQLEELRPRIERLRAAGKPVVAYLEYGGGRGSFYLASACDRVIASQEAFFPGLALRAERRYYRAALDSLGIRVDRASIGKYKSAYRNFSVDSTSDADREAIERSLDVSQDLFVSAVTASRKIAPEHLFTALDGRAWDAADLAKLGLVDSVGYRETAVRALGTLAGLGPRPRQFQLRSAESARTEWTRPTGIAVVYASGGIENGRSGSDFLNGPYMGNETVVRQLQRAFRRRDVKAVVLRVESPGGSSTASDLMHHATLALKRETKKPLIVSMGGVAASGGYHLACGADRIFADRATRTGSIGVLFVKPSFEKFYAKHGIRQDVFQRGRYAGGLSYAKDWTPELQASADSAIARGYERFVAHVAAGRHMSRDSVRAAAQGRVWYGEEALALGLVDEIGGLERAISEARRRAGIPEGEKLAIAEYRRPRGPILERLLGTVAREVVARALGASEAAGPREVAEGGVVEE